MVTDCNAEYIDLLELAFKPFSVADFAVDLFGLLSYVRRYRVARILSAHVDEKLRTLRQYGEDMKPLDSRQAMVQKG